MIVTNNGLKSLNTQQFTRHYITHTDSVHRGSRVALAHLTERSGMSGQHSEECAPLRPLTSPYAPLRPVARGGVGMLGFDKGLHSRIYVPPVKTTRSSCIPLCQHAVEQMLCCIVESGLLTLQCIQTCGERFPEVIR
jgi:hypothetical protein